MADSETVFVSEANDSEVERPKLETRRMSHAFSIEKLLSVTSATTSQMCLRITSEESLEPVSAGRAGNRQEAATDNTHLGVTEEDNGTVQYRYCSYGRRSAITSVVSADSSSVACCSECEEDPELEVSSEATGEVTVQTSAGAAESAAEVSTTLTDGCEQRPQSGEFELLLFRCLGTNVHIKCAHVHIKCAHVHIKSAHAWQNERIH